MQRHLRSWSKGKMGHLNARVVFSQNIGLPLSFQDCTSPSSFLSTALAGAFELESSTFVLTSCQNKIHLTILAQGNLCCCPEPQQLMILSITIHRTLALTSSVDMASTSRLIILHHLIDASQIFQVIWIVIQNESVRSTKQAFCRSASFPQRHAHCSQWFYVVSCKSHSPSCVGGLPFW